jgi:hypothetical protein
VAPEYEVKAAFVFNFAKFVDWPAGTWTTADSTFQVCVLGGDPFGPVLDETLAGKVIDGHAVEVRRLTAARSVQSCAVLFVGISKPRELTSVLNRVRNMPMLTVGEGREFAESGGMIGMFVEGDHVRFAINTDAAAAAHLAISSRLLQLAEIIHSTQERGQ